MGSVIRAENDVCEVMGPVSRAENDLCEVMGPVKPSYVK
jgi:rRNA processing protein Gar1